MADNFSSNPGIGGDTFGADDIGGIKYPRSKLIFGPDGTNSGDVSASNGLPVNVVANSAPLPAGANTIGAVNIAAGQTLGTVTNITNWGNVVDNAAFIDGTSRVSLSGYVFDEVAGTLLTENDAAAARIDDKRAQVMVVEDAATRGRRQTVSAFGAASVTPVSNSSGGQSMAKVLTTATTNATNVKASGGQLYGWSLSNSSVSAKFIRFHNNASTPTAGVGVLFTVMLPSMQTVSFESNFGIPLSNGIAYTIVTGAADTDTTATAAGDVQGVILYK